MGMTREEAAKWIREHHSIDMHVQHDEAMRTALKALEQEPCEDYISRQAVDEIKELMTDINGDTVYAVRMSDLRQLSPVTSKPKTGHWIEHESNGIHHIECSECSSWFLRLYLVRNGYCPNCGAKMQEVTE